MKVGIQGFRINCFEFPRDRVIGDSQITIDFNSIASLELYDENGVKGLGFLSGHIESLPDKKYLEGIFRDSYMPGLINQAPESLVHRVTRPRGGNFSAGAFNFSEAIDQALWDLSAKRAELPLYKYLGGTESKVLTYGSGCCFPLSDQELHDFYTSCHAQYNFSAYKVKIGHPDLEWDLRRLEIFRDAVGPQPLLMVDSNEAWSPREAIRRINAYQDHGFSLFWVEDPIIRHDIEGLKEIKQAFPNIYLNAGEYLPLNGKSKLVEENAADVINIHGNFSTALRIGYLCAEHGIPVAVGNTMMEVGANIASALPEVLYTEYSQLNTDIILSKKYEIKDGYTYLPDTPGHGLEISDSAILDFKQT